MSEAMTPEQIENWRRVLCGMIGPYALLIPKEDIQLFRDKMQSDVNREAEKLEQQMIESAKPCQCDPNHEGKTVHADGRVTCNKCHKERK